MAVDEVDAAFGGGKLSELFIPAKWLVEGYAAAALPSTGFKCREGSPSSPFGIQSSRPQVVGLQRSFAPFSEASLVIFAIAASGTLPKQRQDRFGGGSLTVRASSTLSERHPSNSTGSSIILSLSL